MQTIVPLCPPSLGHTEGGEGEGGGLWLRERDAQKEQETNMGRFFKKISMPRGPCPCAQVVFLGKGCFSFPLFLLAFF